MYTNKQIMRQILTSDLPLTDYTVLDLTIARAGPTAARVLADWGANVIQINPPNKPAY